MRTIIVQEIIENYTQKQEDVNIALNRLHDSDDKIISFEELKAKLASHSIHPRHK